MDFLELANKRQSCRAYDQRPVEPDKIARCIAAARVAPSACNSQPWKFVVVNDPSLRKTVAQATFGPVVSLNRFTMQAPVLIAIVSERQKLTAKIGNIVRKKSFNQMDVAIAAEHFCLAATELDLGTCIIGWFDEQAVKRTLAILSRKRVELIITVGYPASDQTRPKKRKPLEDITCYNRYE
jgi:nitroreductase